MKISLEERVKKDIKAAKAAKDKKTLEALQAINAVFKWRNSRGYPKNISKPLELMILQALVKERKDLASIYQCQGREDRYNEVMEDINIISRYFPEPMSGEAVDAAIREFAEKEDLYDITDMSRLMEWAHTQLLGRTDNETISRVIKSILFRKHE
jgi:uncharacterized protein YqeY